MVVCDMVTAPAAARAARPAGRHAVTARRLVDAFISRLRGRPSAPAADPPAGRKLLTTRKTRGTTMRRRRSASPYFRLINYWRRQNAAAAGRPADWAGVTGRPAVKTDWLCISTRFESPAILFCSHIRNACSIRKEIGAGFVLDVRYDTVKII